MQMCLQQEQRCTLDARAVDAAGGDAVIRSAWGSFLKGRSDGTGTRSEVSLIRVVNKLSKQAGRYKMQSCTRAEKRVKRSRERARALEGPGEKVTSGRQTREASGHDYLMPTGFWFPWRTAGRARVHWATPLWPLTRCSIGCRRETTGSHAQMARDGALPALP